MDVAGMSRISDQLQTATTHSEKHSSCPAGDGNLTSTPSGGQSITWTSSNGGLEIAQEIAANELAHVKFLRAALSQAGATPVSTNLCSACVFVQCFH